MTENSSPAVDAALILMSLITGEEWDETKLADSAEYLRATAKAVLMVRGGMTSADADKVIDERWTRYVAPIEPPAEPTPLFADVAVDPQPLTSGEVSSRLDGYLARNEINLKRKDIPAEESEPAQ